MSEVISKELSTIDDVLVVIGDLLDDAALYTCSRSEFLDEIQMLDSGLSLYEVKLLYDAYMQLKKG